MPTPARKSRIKLKANRIQLFLLSLPLTRAESKTPRWWQAAEPSTGQASTAQAWAVQFCQCTCNPCCSSTGHFVGIGCQPPALCQTWWVSDVDRCLLGPGMRAPDSFNLWLKTDVRVRYPEMNEYYVYTSNHPPIKMQALAQKRSFPNLRIR